jgi:hypothetical protein
MARSKPEIRDEVTFFRKRDHAPLRQVAVRVGGRKCSMHLHPADRLPRRLVKPDQAYPNATAYRAFKGALLDAMFRAGGGLLVEIPENEDKHDNLDVFIETVATDDSGAYTQPKALFCIYPGGDLYEHSLMEPATRLSLPPDSHLILPVDAYAEERFRSFLANYVAWFPPDFQTSIMSLLRSPSMYNLEQRMQRVERTFLDIVERRKSREWWRLNVWFERFLARWEARRVIQGGESGRRSQVRARAKGG